MSISVYETVWHHMTENCLHYSPEISCIVVGGSTLGNEVEMLYTVPVIPPPCFFFFFYNYGSNYADMPIIKMFPLYLKHHHPCHHQLFF